MRQPNRKEWFVIGIYKTKIENREFDEQDIISFLIYIRSFLEKADKSKYWNIYDICDFAAHRSRDSGKTQAGICAAIENNYQTTQNSKEIRGYEGIKPEKWEEEWNNLGRDFNISFNAHIIHEISICVLSMLQFSEFYQDLKKGPKRNPLATMIILQGKDFLSLCSTEGKSDSKYIVYFNVDGLSFTKKYEDVIIDDAVYAKRENGVLRLINDCGDYIV